MKLSQRAQLTPASPIRRLSPLASAAKKRGTTVYHLNIGQPDIRSPKEFFDGLALYKDEVVAYEHSGGNEELRKIWCESFNRSLDLNAQTADFLITTGASEGLIFLFMVCCDPGNEILVIDPTYANYKSFAAIAGVHLVSVPSFLDQGFALSAQEEISSRITERTRAILLCNPNNPTGTVYSREELTRILDLCDERDLYLIVDETYREFVYDDLTPLSILHIAPNNPRVIVVDSLSKRFSLCGARIGCLITKNEEVMQGCMNVAQSRLASPTIEQFAAAHMLRKVPDTFIAGVVAEYQSRRDTAIRALQSIPGVVTQNPKGAFYTVARLPVENAEDFAKFMLTDFSSRNETTFVAPAEGFYMNEGRGKNKIRIAFVLESAKMQRAVELLGEGLASYTK